MKSNRSNTKKRVLAIVLCMVLMLSSGISTMADGEVAAGAPTPESGASQEPVAASVEGETVEGEHTPAEKSTDTQEETPTESSAAENKDEPAADSNTLSGVTELVGGSGTQDNAPEQGTETDLTEQESEIVSEATELKQEFTDEAGNVTQRVTANIPEGAFQANASEITMEVNYLDEAAENHVKELMTAALPENEILGDYILYDIKFKVNGEVTVPQKAITITLEGSGLHIKDTKKANAFYIDPADLEVQDDKDEIVEITQKREMIENLQNAGQSIEGIDEYDLSEIFVNADGTADKIQMEGRVSTVYGCYVEETLEPVQTLTYEDDDVIVNVDAYTEDSIPQGASLRVVPIRQDDKETEEQYKEVEEQLNRKADNEGYNIAGFLAYDISFVNESDREIEPNGYVKVTMEYKNEAIPEGIEENSNLGVTVMHLEEDGKGDIKEVVDMVADVDKEAAVETTENAKVKKAEFTTDSFSAYTITWTRSDKKATVNMHYGFMSGSAFVEFTKSQLPSGLDNIKLDSPTTIDLQSSLYKLMIPGYDFNQIKRDTPNGNTVRYLMRGSYSDDLECSADGYYYTDWLELKSKNTTGDLYYIYTSNSGGDGGEGSTENTLDAPEHNKYIKYNEEDNDYTLTLDVKGEKGKTIGADVLLVIDKSGSMSGSLLKQLKSTVEEIVPEILPNNTTVNKMAAVSFSSADYGNDISTSWLGYNGRNSLISNVNGLSANGATNWQLAMRRAESKLSANATSDNQKYVIFLSDGEPTKYYESDKWGNESEKGNGQSFYQIGLDNAVSEVTNSNYLKDAKIYSVYLTSNTKTRMTEFSTKLKGKNVDSVAVDGTNMDDAIKKIVDQIITPAYTNVVIEDTLSDNVDFAEEHPVFVVEYTKNNKKYTLESSKYQVTKNGKKSH